MTHPPDDLDWLAFRYLAGELTAAQQHNFEALLDRDQAAREAVARAVELTAALTDSGQESNRVRPAPERRGAWRQRVGLGVALAASLALLIVGWNWEQESEPPGQSPPLASHGAAHSYELAVTWTEMHDEFAQPALAWSPWTSEAAGESGEVPHAVEELEGYSLDQAVEQLDAPDWMLAAVESSQQASPGEAPRAEIN